MKEQPTGRSRSATASSNTEEEEVMPQLRVFLSELPPLTDPTGAGHPRTAAECCKHPQKPTPLEEHLPKTRGPRPQTVLEMCL